MLTLFGAVLNGKAIGLVILFSIVEIIIMAVWLNLVLDGHGLAGFAVLAVGLLIEHFISAATGVHVRSKNTNI